MRKIITKSESETQKIAYELIKNLKNTRFICLYGDLGSGKTTFTKGLAKALGIDSRKIKSPTYTYTRSYNIQKNTLQKLHHFDFYRIHEIDDLMAKDLEEIFDNKESLIIIEWPEGIEALLPKKRINIHLEYINSSSRKIHIHHDL